MLEDKTRRRDSSSSKYSRSRSRSKSRSKSKDKKLVPTTEPQLKYVILKTLQSDSFSYPIPTKDAYEALRQAFKDIKGAYAFLGRLNNDKVLEDIASSGGIRLESLSKGTQLATFIMYVDPDKIEQLCRESYKDRPKIEVDIELIGNETSYEESLRKKEEDQKRSDEERVRQRSQSLPSHQSAHGLQRLHQQDDKKGDEGNCDGQLRDHQTVQA